MSNGDDETTIATSSPESLSQALLGSKTSRRRMLQVTLGAAGALWAGGLISYIERAPAARAEGGEGGEGDSPTIVVRWNAAALAALVTAHAGPTVGARALAIVHTCMYDAWAAYQPKALGTQLGNTRRAETHHRRADETKAVSYAAYRALLDLFPAQSATFAALMTSLGYDPTDTTTDTTTPAGVGNVAARAVIDFRHQDGSNQFGGYADTTGYVPVNDPSHINDPNRWQPLLVNGVAQHFVTPQWGLVVPFALSSGSQFRPVAPERYPGDGYRSQAQALIDFSAGLTDTQKVIAEYWANPPAPAIWSVFAQFVSQRDGHGLRDDITMFFALSNVWLDSLIAVWDAKRAYDSERPITAIHYLFAGTQITAWGGPFQGTRQIDGGTWRPYLLVTPAFPEYVSAHSAVSAASAAILSRATGSSDFGLSHTQSAGTSSIEPGVTPATDVALSWDTFSDAADQAGISRRYGGIHFEEGDLHGRALGAAVAGVVWDKAQFYITGGQSESV
jgi:hypothetical protein